jgi:hypothetical protein
MNRGQLKLRVGRVCGISLGTSTDEQDDVQLLDELANEAVLDVLRRTRVHVRSGDADIDSSGEFEVDQSVLKIWGITRGEQTLKLQDKDELTSSGYAFTGFNRLILGSPGATDDSTLLLWYTPRPTPMTDDANDPATEAYGLIPPEFHLALVNYMCWWAADKAGDAQTQFGEKYRVRYEGPDMMGGPGSSLGQIKTAISRRADGNRVVRAKPVLVSDLYSQYYQG